MSNCCGGCHIWRDLVLSNYLRALIDANSTEEIAASYDDDDDNDDTDDDDDDDDDDDNDNDEEDADNDDDAAAGAGEAAGAKKSPDKSLSFSRRVPKAYDRQVRSYALPRLNELHESFVRGMTTASG